MWEYIILDDEIILDPVTQYSPLGEYTFAPKRNPLAFLVPPFRLKSLKEKHNKIMTKVLFVIPKGIMQLA